MVRHATHAASPYAPQLLVGFAYDGAPFHGLAPQPPYPTAGAALLTRLGAVLGPGRPYAISWAARLDAGVHARFNLMSCRWAGAAPGVDVAAALAGLGAPCGDGLGGVAGCVLPQRTLARAMVARKRYRYILQDNWQGPPPAVGSSPGVWHVAPQLDASRMAAAAAAFVGRHDFTAFAAAPRRRGGAAARREKVISYFAVHKDVVPGFGQRFCIDCIACGLLRRQMRHMVFAVACAGAGLSSARCIARALQAGCPPKPGAGQAPARGLTLFDVGCPGPLAAAVAQLRHQVLSAPYPAAPLCAMPPLPRAPWA